jgi:hypothetical protein
MTAAIGHLTNFDRLLAQLPEDQLRRTSDALGIQLTVQFAPNPDPKGRRQRVPVSGTMVFGATNLGRSAATANDLPPAGAEGSSPNDIWLGCGGPYCTQLSSPPPVLVNTLRVKAIHFAWSDVSQAIARLQGPMPPGQHPAVASARHAPRQPAHPSKPPRECHAV